MDYILTLFPNGEFFLCKKIFKTFQNGISFKRIKPEVDISDSFCVTGLKNTGHETCEVLISINIKLFYLSCA